MKWQKVEIRRFAPKYFSEFVELVHSTIKEVYPKVYSKEVTDFFLEYHSARELERKSEKSTILLAFDGEQLIASGYLLKKEIGGVYVKTVYQGRGIGKYIVDELVKEAREKKYDHVWLDATLGAETFYQKSGFQLVEKMTDMIKSNVPLDYYRMYMKL